MNIFFTLSLTFTGLYLFVNSFQCSFAQTKYFDDQTLTHLPQDAKAHALDVILVDVDGDGDISLLLMRHIFYVINENIFILIDEIYIPVLVLNNYFCTI